MAFQPTVLQPTPDPHFVRELQKIDPDLRVVWGYQRYFKNCWAIERRLSPERYWQSYASLFEQGDQRIIRQPIHDTNQPIYAEELDVDGNPILMGYEIIGYRDFDLAPEWEWVLFVENQDGSRKELDSRTITELKRVYAWERFHSLTRLRMEKAAEEEEREKKAKAKRMDEQFDEIMLHKRELWGLPFTGQVGGFRDEVVESSKETK